MRIGINSRDREMSTPLHWACISRSHTVVNYLLAWGADVNAKDSSGNSPLHLAISEASKSKEYSTIKMLLFKGANVNTKDLTGRTPMDLLDNFLDFDEANKVRDIFRR